MKISNKLLLSTIGLASFAIAIPITMTSCNNQKEINYDFIDLDQYKTTNMEIGNSSLEEEKYVFAGALNDEWRNKSFEDATKELELTEKENSEFYPKTGINNDFKNKSSFKSLLNVKTYGPFNGEETPDWFKPQANSLINAYGDISPGGGNEAILNPYWLSPKDINFNIMDKLSAKIEYYEWTNPQEAQKTISCLISFNVDKKYTWSNSSKLPIYFYLISDVINI